MVGILLALNGLRGSNSLFNSPISGDTGPSPEASYGRLLESRFILSLILKVETFSL